MVGTKRSFKTSTKRLIVVSAVLILAVATACGSNDEPLDEIVVVAEQSDTVLDSESVSDSIKTEPNTPASAGPVVVPAVEPVPGSEEAAILDVLDSVGRAMRTQDWNLYLEACNPTRAMFKLPQITFLGEERFNQSGLIAGTSYRDVTVRLYGEDTAITESNLYEYDNLLFENYSHSWTKLDGNWYSNSNCNRFS